MNSPVEQFYDNFSGTLLKDYVFGNRRIEFQCKFFAEAVPPSIREVLILGCGSGEVAYWLATRVALNANIYAVDLSAANLELAKQLFAHPRIRYEKRDVVTEPVSGRWDVIILPDVYEHIPVAGRQALHAMLNNGLSPHGCVLLTIPSPEYQTFLLESGKGLQIVDEQVTLDNILTLARDIRGILSYYRYLSVFKTNDYVHILIERGTITVQSLTAVDKLPIKGWENQSKLWWGEFIKKCQQKIIRTPWRRWRARRLFSRSS